MLEMGFVKHQIMIIVIIVVVIIVVVVVVVGVVVIIVVVYVIIVVVVIIWSRTEGMLDCFPVGMKVFVLMPTKVWFFSKDVEEGKSNGSTVQIRRCSSVVCPSPKLKR